MLLNSDLAGGSLVLIPNALYGLKCFTMNILLNLNQNMLIFVG